MNLTIESLNLWGVRALEFAWPALWQSSLLIGLLFTLNFAFRRRVRAAVRYALWLVVLLKLVLPPALALPTGLSWWLRPAKAAPAAPPPMTFTVTSGPSVAPPMLEAALTLPVAAAPARPALTLAAWALMLSSTVSLGLLGWMLLRWRQVARDVRQAEAAPQALQEMLEEARCCSGLRRPVRLGLTERPMSPAVCGLFRPTILLPRSLAERLAPAQLRAVLLHELAHLRRGDVWVNCAQALLQVAYWWHPLLWLANARIRQAREEAVDDAVMAALQEEAEAYAPTLLEVARLALQRPLTSLGLVGILESRSSLRQRIQRLLEFHPPRKAGLTLASALLVLAFAALAVPMGEAPAPTAPKAPAGIIETTDPLANVADTASPQIHIQAKFIEVPEAEVAAMHARFPGTNAPGSGTWGTLLSPEQLREQFHQLDRTDGADVLAAPEVTTRIGRQCQMRSTDLTNIVVFDRSSLERITETESTFSILPQTNATPQTNPIEVGNILDAFPLLETDGCTVHLKTIITAIEFLGYTNPPDGGSPFPQVRIRDFSSLSSVPDGQTLVLDSPAMAGATSKRKHHVLVFITPRLIDSVGNPLHKDETLRVIRQSKLRLEALPADFSSRSLSPNLMERKRSAAMLVHDGRLLYQMGKLDEAKVKLHEASKLDPQNQAAYYYLNLLAEAKVHDALHVTPPARLRGRQLIYKKLDTIWLDDAFLQVSTLGEALPLLNAQAREHDPDKTGINFIITSSGTSSGEGTSATNSPGMSAADTASVRLTLKPSSTRQKLADILDEVVKSAERPVKYSVEDYAVVFSARQGREVPPLFTREYEIDPATLSANLYAATGRPTNAQPQTISEALRNFFGAKGVQLAPPKSIFFNDRGGHLFVRATAQDLDTIEEAIHTLNKVPVQINIKAKFVEVAQTDNKAFGFDWYLGNLRMNQGSIGLSGGSTPSFAGQPSPANPAGSFPGNSAGGTTIPPSTSDGLVTKGLRNPADSLFTLTGILTDPQFRVVLHALDQRDGSDVLAAPEVTTISGRAAHCKALQVLNVVKGVKARALTSPGVPKGEENSLFEVEPMELGPVLDVAPTLLADGFTVKLSLWISLDEFLGYEPNPTNRVTVYVDGKPKQVRLPQPIVRQAKVSSEVNVWDGQTVVLGGLISERLLPQKDGVSGTTQKRNLMVFITPTLVDAAGNRVHSEDEMPFTMTSIPPQPTRSASASVPPTPLK